MKKMILLTAVLALLLTLAACQSSVSAPQTEPAGDTTVQTPAPETPEASQPETPAVTVQMYIPNANADGFDLQETTVAEANAEQLLAALVQAGVLPEDVAVNSCELAQDASGATVIALDLNDAFSQALQGTGTAGETMLLGSLVNTFLDALDAQSLTLTVDGKALATGHNVYDEPLTKFQ